jgi:hypothetical protein
MKPTVTTTVTTTLIVPCSQPVWNGSNIQDSSNDVPVLLMRPDSTGYVCVTYQTVWKGNASEYQSQYTGFQTYPFDLSIGQEHCFTSSGGGGGCTASISHSFITSALLSSIQLSGITDYFTIVYAVTALSNSTGFYDNSAPYLYSCNSMPMAVGYTASQVNASDFALRLVPSCPLQALSPTSLSVAGMNFTYVQFS